MSNRQAFTRRKLVVTGLVAASAAGLLTALVSIWLGVAVAIAWGIRCTWLTWPDLPTYTKWVVVAMWGAASVFFAPRAVCVTYWQEGDYRIELEVPTRMEVPLPRVPTCHPLPVYHMRVMWHPEIERDVTRGYTELQVPLWFVVLLAWSYVLFRWWKRRVRPGHCAGCGYDLTGNVSGVCPECGLSVVPDASRGGGRIGRT